MVYTKAIKPILLKISFERREKKIKSISVKKNF